MPATLQMPGAIFFDLDDTLYPERDFVFSGYRAVASYLRSELGVNADTEGWLGRRFLSGKTAGAFNEMNDHFALGLDDETIEGLIDIYRYHEPAIAPFDDIPALLSELSGRFPLGIVSDGPEKMQRNKLAKLGLEKHFLPEAIVFTSTLGEGRGKPSPAGFEKAGQAVGVEHSKCVYIGDNPAKDFLAPNRLGWTTVQVLRENQVHSHKQPPAGGDPAVVVNGGDELAVVLLGKRE